MGAPAPAAGGVDGPGRASSELHTDVAGGGRSAGRPEYGLVACEPGDRAAEPSGSGASRILLAEPPAGHVQFASGAAARWQRGNHAVYERKPGAAVLGLAARQQLRDGGSARGLAGFPVLLRSSGEFRHEPALAQSLLTIREWFSFTQFRLRVPSPRTSAVASTAASRINSFIFSQLPATDWHGACIIRRRADEND